jgi:hypothetical protein
MLMWFTSALGAGLGQAIVLRRLIARAWLWPVVTIAGTVAGTLAVIGMVVLAGSALREVTGFLVPRRLSVLALGPLCGFILGWSQHWLLRPHGISRQWIIATTAAAFVTAPMYGVIVVFIDSLAVGPTRLVFSDEVEWSLGALGLVLMWAIVALATGLFLRRAPSRNAA